MKKVITAALISVILLTACSAENKVIDGKTYTTYGLINSDENKNPNIQYEISGWSVFWSVLLCQTVIAPIYFIGFDLYQPVGVRDPSFVPGQIK